MGLANIPDDWSSGYIDYVIRWPNSPQWEAILRGQLNNPAFEDFWDLFSGNPEASIEAMWPTFDTNLHLEEGAVIPAGLIIDYAGETIPDGWLLCDGSTISRVEYPRLFNAIGEFYGPGNGTTTFEIPDSRGRVLVGLNDGDSAFGELGGTGGTQTVNLTTSQIPIHTHVQDSHNHLQNAHSHVQADVANASGGNVGYSANGNINGITGGASTASTTAVNQATIATNQNTGGGLPHNNLQPYLVTNSIIKT